LFAEFREVVQEAPVLTGRVPADNEFRPKQTENAPVCRWVVSAIIERSLCSMEAGVVQAVDDNDVREVRITCSFGVRECLTGLVNCLGVKPRGLSVDSRSNCVMQ
jgi:hypothetical protein